MPNIKKVILSCLLLCFVIISQSCSKHRRQIRVRNSFASPVNVVVGPVDFGSVATGKTTEYKDIPKGHSEISGDVTGSIEVPNGKHHYTLWVNAGGKVSLIEEDK